uniref:Molybdate-anion transporter n=1 Tax=Ditylum brightwellii TaxID=49249 RepID=A0A7S1ZEB7_9STRA|mmetsp:Transcript_30108/g.44766  ORF Transcript_30108/g.44766 Transcript_30108/m.44766 type:complete len:351 (+) Transcript_30108:1-1053(+)
MVGGITTNLLFSVFETWLVTEHRRRGFAEEKLETILRDSVIASNLAAIVSGWIAHVLAAKYGPVGPFEGAVTCTAIALVLVAAAWTENYGSESPGTKSIRSYMGDALNTIVSDSQISRIGIIQGLTEGSLQTFVFLWSPALRHFATKAPMGVLGLDENGEPAYGLIFGAFMACGVVGGFSEHLARKAVTWCVTPPDADETDDTIAEVEGEGKVCPVAIELLASISYFICAGLLFIPSILSEDSPYSFSIALVAFLVYEFMIGLYMPCEGVIRSIYMPTASRCSLVTMLRVVVNVAVALGVVSTNFIPFSTAFASVSSLMVISASLQLSLVSGKKWRLFIDRLRTFGRKAQ